MESPAANESLREFLDRRERELTHQIAALRGQIGPREAELAEIQRAKSALQSSYGANLNSAIGLGPYKARVPRTRLAHIDVDGEEKESSVPMGSIFGLYPSIDELPIKGLVVKALSEHFRQGATPVELREYFQNAYGRTIDRSSLSPQLTRLKEDGVIEQGDGGIWKLRAKGFAVEP